MAEGETATMRAEAAPAGAAASVSPGASPKSGTMRRFGKRLSSIFSLSGARAGSGSARPHGSGARTHNYLRVVTACQGAGAMKARSKEDRIIALDNLEEFVHANFRGYDLSKFGENDFPPAPPARDQWPRDLVYPEDYVSGRNGQPRATEQDLIAQTRSAQGGNGEGSGAASPASAPSAAAPGVDRISLRSGSTAMSGPATPGTRRSVFKLFCVFDGHCGQICSSYLQYRFPFQLTGSAEFKAGNFEQALASTFRECHRHLLECSKYGPEAPTNDFSSGATSSAVLVTPQNTYFAFVGDSPILIQYRDRSRPEILFKEHDIENELLHRYLIDANMFLVGIREGLMHHEYNIITDPAAKRHVFAANMKQKEVDSGARPAASRRGGRHGGSRGPSADGGAGELEAFRFDDVRVGMSALNVWGTLGDSIYDVEVFNTFLYELHTFREERFARWKRLMEQNGFAVDAKLDDPHHDHAAAAPAAEPVRRQFALPAGTADKSAAVLFGFERPTFPKASLKTLNPRAQFSYVEFRDWFVTRPAWTEYLSRHISLLPKESQMSRILLAAIHKLQFPAHALAAPGLIRTPATARIANRRLKLFCVASDGVIRFYEQLKAEFDSVLVKHVDSNMERCVEEMKKLLEWIGDDRSVILGKYVLPVLDMYEEVPSVHAPAEALQSNFSPPPLSV